MLRITKEALSAIREHGEQGFPEEICGLLVGYVADETRTAREAWPVENAWDDAGGDRSDAVASFEAKGGEVTAADWEAEGRGRRYQVSSKDILGGMKRARTAGMDLVGVYHTHPNHPAIASEYDRQAAWPEWSYLILSVRDGKADEVKSWVLAQDQPRFDEEEIEEI